MVSIVVATKNSQTLNDCIETIKQNTDGEYEIVIVNAGDNEIQRSDAVVYNRAGLRLTEQLELGVAHAKDFVVAFCDDHFPARNWLAYALEDFWRNFPDGYGVLALNECWGHRGSKACVVLVKKFFIEKHLGGYLYDTRLNHYYCDDELRARAVYVGRYAYSHCSIVRHRHRRNSALEAKFWNIDKAKFREIVSKGYENETAKNPIIRYDAGAS